MQKFYITHGICRHHIDELAPNDYQKTSLPLTIGVVAALNLFGHASYLEYVGNNFNLPMSQ